MMELSDNEKIFIKELLKSHYNDFKNEKKVLISEDFPTFLAVEEEYEEFLKALIEKFNKIK